MKKFLAGAAVVFLGFSRLRAGELLPRQALGGKQLPGQAGTVEIRFRREEAGDDRQRGYLFHYELRNASTTQVAKVSLAFAWQNPKALKWDRRHHRQPVRSIPPAATTVDHGALIICQDGFTSKPEKEIPRQVNR
jgi:hypothetical protein